MQILIQHVFVENHSRRPHKLSGFVIAHGGFHAFLSRQRLDAFQAGARVRELGESGMTEPVGGDVGPVDDATTPFFDQGVQSVPGDGRRGTAQAGEQRARQKLVARSTTSGRSRPPAGGRAGDGQEIRVVEPRRRHADTSSVVGQRLPEAPSGRYTRRALLPLPKMSR